MSSTIEITLDGQTFKIANIGGRTWGRDLTNWIITANDILSISSDTNNIPVTQATLSPGGDINAYEFTDPTNDRHVLIEYGIYRVTTSTNASETGVLILAYNPTTAAWQINNTSVGDASVTFSMSGANILVATAAVLAGTESTSLLTFKGRIIRAA